MAPDDAHRLELQIATLQRTVETGFATTRGEVRMLANGSERMREDLDKLEKEIDSLKDRRMPLQIVGPVIGVSALLVSIVPYLIR